MTPYGIGGVLTTLQRTGCGDTERKYHFNELGLGGVGGIGADAGIADGVALGGMAVANLSGSSDFSDGELYNRASALALNTYASIPLTVWR
ncbi:MAG: hypothetical protein GWP91_04585 [Rhodobacterales bacterium]|nr:hypothetical protein [Rhodobacterales bacterium]